MADRFHRRSIRLMGYDYAQEGAYYVTICTHARSHLFGAMRDGVMHATPMGVVVEQCWDAIPVHMPMVELDEFIVMPNHVHGIIVITGRPVAGDPDDGRGGKFPAPMDPSPATTDMPPRQKPMMVKDSLGHIMQTFKAAVTRQAVKDGLIGCGTPIWQRGYYDHIIRNAAAYDRIAQYIRNNPSNWSGDEMNG